MKNGWQMTRFGNVCQYDKEQGIHEHLPYVGLEHIESHTARFLGSKDPLCVKSATFKFSRKHVLYGRLRPYLNKALAPHFDGHCSTEIFPIKPSPHVTREYLLYWLLADHTRDRINATCTGARMPRADMNEVLDFEFPLPSLPEQCRIVAVLDQAFAAIATAKANTEKNLQNARALFETHLESVFSRGGPGWVKRRLGEVFEITSSKRIRETEWTSSGVPFYGGKEIVKLAKFGSVVSDSYISEAKYRDYASKYDMPRKGDLLITARGTIGAGYVVSDNARFYYKDGNIISLREKAPTNPLFFLFAFRSKPLREQFGDLTGATVKHLPINRAKDLIVNLPNAAVQNATAEHLRAMETKTQHLASIYERKLAALDELKKSLLHGAFTGEL